MKVAIIGGGIAGLMAAEQLNGVIDYTVFEQADYLGGHANTQHVYVDGKTIAVDTGFIVFNDQVYHHFNGMLQRYGVESIQSDMSFAISNRVSGLEYNATSISTLFCQKRNWFNPKFYRMIWDIKRFYGAAEGVLASNTDIGIGAYLAQNNYGGYFVDEHIMPMVSALWSGDFKSVEDYPLKYLFQFMKNHQMLQLDKRPEWRTIKNGSQAYVKAIQKQLTGEIKLSCPVTAVSRKNHQVQVMVNDQTFEFDAVVFATHTDVTLNLLQDASEQEKQALGAIPYVENHMDLHTDISLLPKNPKAWASWSVNRHVIEKPVCTVNYYMNLLQSLPIETPLIVSLNQHEYIDNSQILLSKKYQHPVYNKNTINAQNSIKQLQGKQATYFCGAYMGWGFHEDGARSGVEVAQLIKQR